MRLQSKEQRSADPDRNHDERRWRARRETLDPDEHHDDGDANRQREQRGFRDRVRDRYQVPNKRRSHDVHAQHFRKLVRYDDDGNTRFEAHQHGLGNEIGDESQPKKRRGDENHPDKQRQRRVRRERDRSIDARDIGKRRRRQNGQRRRRADTERQSSHRPSLSESRRLRP